jgi:glycogen debranching enzyme
LRRYTTANLRREYGTRTRLSQDIGVIGSFAQALLAGLRQSDDGPENLRPGTVWPWLMGPFLTAYIKMHGRSEPARRQAESWLSAFKDHLADSGLGQVSEIFDGDAPHRPVGCIAQAWSAAELLRATVEDIHGVRPGQIEADTEIRRERTVSTHRTG